jgi:thiol:disulfide interchange protein
MKRHAVLTALFVYFALPAFSQMAAFGGGGPDLTADVINSATGARPGDSIRLAVRVTVPKPWHVNAHEPLDEFLIPTSVEVSPPDGFSFEGAVYPEPHPFQFEWSEDEVLVYEGTFPIGVVVAVGEDVAPGDYPVGMVLTYQACNDTQCAPPATLAVEATVTVLEPGSAPEPRNDEVFSAIDFDQAVVEEASADRPDPAAGPEVDDDWQERAQGFEVTGRNSGYMGTDDFIAWVGDVETGSVSASLNRFAGLPLWWVAVLTLLGGLLLNLTPCVLPMIPINLAIIGAGAQSKSAGRGFTLGATYGLGMAIVYGALGLLAALTGTAFGTLNANPWFNIGIAILFVVLALAMFDVISIDFSRFQSKMNLQGGQKGSFALALFMGCVAALLAGACVAPVVISVVLFAQDLYAEGAVVLGVALPFLLGVGMALPWPFAGAGMSFLPKPGKWMSYVKYAFGVFILVLAAYYGWEGYSLYADRNFGDAAAVEASVEELDADGWTHSLSAGLAEARATGKPVFIDFWATWCKNCLTMNKTTFKDAEVKNKLDGYVKIKYQAQQPNASPHVDVMERFGVEGLGLPVYVIAEPPE